MEGVFDPHALQEELTQYYSRGVIVSSDRAGELVRCIAAIDSSNAYLPRLIDLASRFLPQDKDLSERLTTLFTKAVSVPPSPLSGERLIQSLFYANPDVLAEPLIDFVREDPMGKRQTAALKIIFNSHSLRQDALECFYPPESYAQKVQGLKTAAAGIDNLRAQKGFSDIVQRVITSVESQKGADRQYETLFPS